VHWCLIPLIQVCSDVLCTCVYVHRRDRCTRTFLQLFGHSCISCARSPPRAPVILTQHPVLVACHIASAVRRPLCGFLRSSRCLVWLGSLPRLGSSSVGASLRFLGCLLCSFSFAGGPPCFRLAFCLFGLSLCLLLPSLPLRSVPFGALVQLLAGPSL